MALNKAVDDLASRNQGSEGCSWKFKVSLEKEDGETVSGYMFTDESYSGHEQMVYQQVKRKIDGRDLLNPPAIMLVDLIKLSTGPKFTQRKEKAVEHDTVVA